MSTLYRISTSHNVALNSLADLVPQPMTPGIQYGRIQPTANGLSYQAPYILYRWSLIESEAAFRSLLNQFGLLNASELLSGMQTSVAVTVYIRDQAFNDVRLNGYAQLSVPGNGVEWENYFPRNVEIIVNDLSVPI